MLTPAYVQPVLRTPDLSSKEGQGEGISLHKIPYFSGEFLRSML